MRERCRVAGGAAGGQRGVGVDRARRVAERLVKRGDQRPGTRGPLLGLEGHTRLEHAVERSGQRGASAGELRSRTDGVCGQDGPRGRSGEGRGPREQLEGERREGVDVRTGVGSRSRRELRGERGRKSGRRGAEREGRGRARLQQRAAHTEPGELRAQAGGAVPDQNAARPHVEVHEARGVDGVEGAGELVEHSERLLGVEGTRGEAVAEGATLEPGPRDERAAVLLACVHDAHERRMAHRLRFVDRPLEGSGRSSSARTASRASSSATGASSTSSWARWSDPRLPWPTSSSIR
jgi:hypothetical protein